VNELFLIIWTAWVRSAPTGYTLNYKTYAQTAESGKEACKIIRAHKKEEDVMEIKTFRIVADQYFEKIKEVDVLCE
jgi:hypothetical protein